jgi:hypothetical protein
LPFHGEVMGSIRRDQAQCVAAAPEKAAERLRDVADDLRAPHSEGLSLNAMARQLNEQGVRSPRGAQWTPTAVSRALARPEAR